MAKTQGISLNPSEITGMCGRLRCCLVYEYEQYVEARKQLPKRNKKVGTPGGIGKVIDVHPLQDAVTVFIEEQGRQLVQREELVPLEEYEAFLKKAEEPCAKNEGGSCSCQTTPAQTTPAQPVQSQKPPEAPAKASEGATTEAGAEEKSQRRSDKRRSGRRGRKRRSSKRKDQSKNKQSGNQSQE